LRRDLDWLDRLAGLDRSGRALGRPADDGPPPALAAQVLAEWRRRLEDLSARPLDQHERRLIAEARATLTRESARTGQSARVR
jgi:hypothetical protein